MRKLTSKQKTKTICAEVSSYALGEEKGISDFECGREEENLDKSRHSKICRGMQHEAKETLLTEVFETKGNAVCYADREAFGNTSLQNMVLSS